MIIIVGLGNPGKKYELTRHNVGFRILDALAQKFKSEPFKLDKQSNSLISAVTLSFPGQKKHVRIILVKPQTYMNRSGSAVKKLMDSYKLRSEDQLWVIYDDLDIELGTVRIRLNGSSAGQKGVQSIIEKLGTDHFVRFRFGIKSNNYNDKVSAEEFVLQNFTDQEEQVVKLKTMELTDKIYELIDQGITSQSF